MYSSLWQIMMYHWGGSEVMPIWRILDLIQYVLLWGAEDPEMTILTVNGFETKALTLPMASVSNGTKAPTLILFQPANILATIDCLNVSAKFLKPSAMLAQRLSI